MLNRWSIRDILFLLCVWWSILIKKGNHHTLRSHVAHMFILAALTNWHMFDIIRERPMDLAYAFASWIKKITSILDADANPWQNSTHCLQLILYLYRKILGYLISFEKVQLCCSFLVIEISLHISALCREFNSSYTIIHPYWNFIALSGPLPCTHICIRISKCICRCKCKVNDLALSEILNKLSHDWIYIEKTENNIP